MDQNIIRNLLRRAKKGDDDAFADLDEFYFDSDETKPYDRKARRCFAIGMKRGSTRAPYMLAKLYIRGGDEKDLQLCPALFGLSIAQGHGFVWNHLGYCYQEGIGTPKNVDTAYDCYMKAAAYGCASGFLYAAHVCMFDKKEFDKAIRLYEKAAENGSAMAAYSLASLYEMSNDIPHDAEKCIRWYRRAAELGKSNTDYEIGSLYAEGAIVQKDMEKAVQYYRQGVAAGCDDCMTALAVCLLNGGGTEQDEAEALRLLKQAANMGNPDALEELQKLKRDVGDGVNPTAK